MKKPTTPKAEIYWPVILKLRTILTTLTAPKPTPVVEEIVAKYTKLIHPQDLGEPTSKLENTLREAFAEITQHHQAEVEKAVEAEKKYALAVIEKYEAMPFSPTTFSRIKASLTPTKSNKTTQI